MKIKIFKGLFIILLVIVIAIIIFLLIISKDQKNNFDLFTVEKGTIQTKIEETGILRKGERINLSFKSAGRIEKLYAKAGDSISQDDLLAEIDSSAAYHQFKQAEANLDLAKAEFEKLLAGASEEEIQVAKTQLQNAENNLKNKQKDLKNVEINAEQDLASAYKDAYSSLDDTYLDLYNAYLVIDSIQRSYFIDNDYDSVDVKDRKNQLNSSLAEMESYLDLLETELVYGDLDNALEVFEQELSSAKSHFSAIKSITEKPNWRGVVSASDKTLIDTNRSYVVTAYSEIIDAKQDINNTKISNQTSIDTAENAILTAEDNLQSAQDNLDLVLSGPTKEEKDLYQAKIASAQAEVDRLRQLLTDTKLRSPLNGEIIEIHKYVGEVIQPSNPVISFLPDEELNIEVDIYEEDIVNIDVGDRVEIDLIAFPDEEFLGTVTFIDPAEKLIDQVVYYEIKISLDKITNRMKPGMSADVAIIAEQKNNVLKIPDDALIFEDNKNFVEVYKDNCGIEKREVEIGLEGTDSYIEIISGLEEGEKAIIQ
jgi:HlyD family secretion protein